MSGCFAASAGAMTGALVTANRWKPPFGVGSVNVSGALRAAALKRRGASASAWARPARFRASERTMPRFARLAVRPFARAAFDGAGAARQRFLPAVAALAVAGSARARDTPAHAQSARVD